MSLGALQAAARIGRSVPHDLAIIDFDDIPESAYFSPTLTTIRQDLLEVGRRSVHQLNQVLEARRFEEPYADQVVKFEPKLIIRKSSVREKT